VARGKAANNRVIGTRSLAQVPKAPGKEKTTKTTNEVGKERKKERKERKKERKKEGKKKKKMIKKTYSPALTQIPCELP